MQKTILSIAVLVVVILGGYLIIKSNKQSEYGTPVVVDTQTQNEETAQPQASGKKIAFSEFTKQYGQGSYKCDVKQAVSDFENNGTVYLSNGNVRGEFTTVAEGRTLDTSFIARDGYTYTWSSALPQMGFKTKMVTTTAETDDAKLSAQYSWNADQIGDYTCVPWTADASKFNIPTNITFKTIGA